MFEARSRMALAAAQALAGMKLGDLVSACSVVRYRRGRQSACHACIAGAGGRGHRAGRPGVRVFCGKIPPW